MRGLGSPRLLARDGGVHRAAALQKHNILLRELLFDHTRRGCSRGEQDIVAFELSDDLDGRGAGYADVAYGFQLCCGIDIGDDGIGGIFLLQMLNQRLVHLLGHRTARIRHRKQHALLG